MRRAVWLGLALVLACSSEGPDGSTEVEPRTSSTASPIINGTLDTENPAVVMLVSSVPGGVGVCTGTIVKTDPATGTGWVATAAHCLMGGTPRTVWEGPDSLGPDRIRHTILSYAADPRFELDRPQDGYDFGVVRIGEVTAATPVVPLTTAPDQISLGDGFSNVGYGRTSKPPAEPERNSKRYFVTAEVDRVSELLLAYDASERGACEGDSGGPWLTGTGANMRVIGIDSYGNETCDGLVFAGRVQAGLDFFAAELGETPPDPCDLCTTLSKSSGGTCATAEGVGLATCVCTEACVDECKASQECTNLPSATNDTDAGATPGPTEPAGDAGPTVVVVHKKGDGGCNASGGANGGSAFAWLALGLVLVRRRARQTR